MFKNGDILKVNLDHADMQYKGCIGTTVHQTMMERAKEWRYEVIDVLSSGYKLRRVHDQQEDIKSQADVHELLVLVDDKPS